MKKQKCLILLTREEVAEVLRVGVGQIRVMIREGALVPTRVGRKAMIPAQNVWNVLSGQSA